MASIRKRDDNGQLFFDFRFGGQRCREQTALTDTPQNRRKLEKVLEHIEAEIKGGTFDYAKFFPNSKMLLKLAMTRALAAPQNVQVAPTATVPFTVLTAPVATTAPLPTFADFASVWVAENEVTWRRSNCRTVNDILTKYLLPAFGEKGVGHITKSDILNFRSQLAKVPGRKAETLSAKRINAILAPLRQILNEAADRFDFTTPYRNIKPLKQVRPDVEPFTLDEVQKILMAVRTDYQNYFTIRFFTGMRTGEIDGLKWQYVDFERRQILIRETIVDGEEDTTKTEGSQREIHMSQRVFDALLDQATATKETSAYVFCNREGHPLDHNNVTKRVWYPLLSYLGLKKRRPYQTRHTAATLWLASGENPLWIARQLGHSSTEMLFKVYGRFVPNLTRQDGSAFERLLAQFGTVTPITPSTTASNDPLLPSSVKESK
jgi:integrase